jgi:excisionase family DNA binding protein
MSPEAFVTANEIAAHLKTTRRQVLELTRKGVLPAHPLGFGSRRRVWRYKLTEVDEAIAPWAKKPSGGGGVVNIARSESTIPVGSPCSRKGQSNG